jgi:PAS domain S-box-containing protein
MERGPSGSAPRGSRRSRRTKRRIQGLAVRYEQAEEAVVATDLEGVILSWNEAATRLFGWTAAEAVGRSAAELMVPEGADEMTRRVLSSVRAGRTWTGEFTLRKRDDTPVTIRVTNAPIVDRLGAVVGIVGVASPVSEGRDGRYIRLEVDD